MLIKAPVVLINGTFNIVHAGHCELFEFASKYGNVFVGVNGEKYVKEKYKEKAIPVKERVQVLSSNKYIYKVLVFEEENACELLRKVRPKYYIKGPDYLNKDYPEIETAKELNIKIIIHEADKINSSSKILNIF